MYYHKDGTIFAKVFGLDVQSPGEVLPEDRYKYVPINNGIVEVELTKFDTQYNSRYTEQNRLLLLKAMEDQKEFFGE